MSLESQVKAYKEMALQIDKLEKEKKALGALILEQMRDKKMEVAGYTSIAMRDFRVKLNVEEARVYGATKTEEVVDKNKIKALYQEGVEMKGVAKSPYILVTISQQRSHAWAE